MNQSDALDYAVGALRAIEHEPEADDEKRERAKQAADIIEQGELGELRRVGDLMQSSLDRVLGWIEANRERLPVMLYEVNMATGEGKDAIEGWTRIRKASR